MKKLLQLLLLGVMASCAYAQDQEKIEKEEVRLSLSAKENTLTVYNIKGSIRVEGTNSNELIVEVTKTIKAKNDKAMQQAEKEFKLGTLSLNDTITLFTAAPYDSRPSQRKGTSDNNRDYSVKLDYVIKVPKALNVKLSTIIDGEIEVSNMAGRIVAKHVNGDIKVHDAVGFTELVTVNGNIFAESKKTPPSGSSYKSVNGTIRVSYPEELNGSLKLKSLNGNFYTDFPDAKLVSDVEKNANRIKAGTQLKVGKGESDINLETLNGDIFIKKLTK